MRAWPILWLAVLSSLPASAEEGAQPATAPPAAEPAPTAATAPPFNPDTYPGEVRKALHYAIEECRREQDGKVTFAPDTVRKLDLTGDHRDDYIVDSRDAQCNDNQVPFCGTGGCNLDIIVALPGGRLRTVFSDRVRGYEILPGPGPGTIRFELHGGYCGGHGNPSCYKTHRITTRKFKFVMPE